MIIERAGSMEEALDMISKGYKPLAGGTNILVDVKVKGDPGCGFADISALEELKGIKEDGEALWIGALVTFSEAEEYLKGRTEYRALYEAAYVMGGPQIRNRATIAGNICDASPACDAGPALLVLNSEIVAASKKGKRILPAENFFKGVRQTVLEPDELVIGIRIPKKEGISFFKKAGERNAMTVSTASVAGKKYSDGKIFLAAGSVAPVPVRLMTTENEISGKNRFSAETIRKTLDNDTDPIDARGVSARYRRAALMNMLSGALEKEFGLERI